MCSLLKFVVYPSEPVNVLTCVDYMVPVFNSIISSAARFHAYRSQEPSPSLPLTFFFCKTPRRGVSLCLSHPKVFIATETIDSSGVYREHSRPVLATTHPVPPFLQDAHARAADASSSALVVTVSLLALAEVHYAVFPAAFEDSVTDTMEAEHHSKGSFGAEDVSASVKTGDGKGREAYASWGCGNATTTGRGPVALNETQSLVASGVVSSATSAASLLVENVDRNPAPAGNVGVATATAAAATAHASGLQQAFAKRVSGGEEAIEVVFRVEGLKAAEAYNVCLFTETPGSNGYVRAMLGHWR